MKYLLLLLLIVLENSEPSRKIDILFVGNSLTSANNLPSLVKEVAKTHGLNITVDLLAYPNYALEDHWKDGELEKRIASELFHCVVVQQGPSSQTEGKAMLLDYGQRLKTLCDKYNTKLAFFMVWPARENGRTFDGVINSYTEAAKQTGALLCPVGKVWKTHFENTLDYSYYGPDGFHPSPEGSRVAAMVIFESLQLL